MATQTSSVATQLLKLALPLVPKTGFRTSTLIQASRELPGAPSTVYTAQTINALFPSPAANPGSPSLIGRRQSLTRKQLVAEAQGKLSDAERVGPAKALLQAWLVEGRRQMVSNVHNRPERGELAIRQGLRDRLKYNEPVLHELVEVHTFSCIESQPKQTKIFFVFLRRPSLYSAFPTFQHCPRHRLCCPSHHQVVTWNT